MIKKEHEIVYDRNEIATKSFHVNDKEKAKVTFNTDVNGNGYVVYSNYSPNTTSIINNAYLTNRSEVISSRHHPNTEFAYLENNGKIEGTGGWYTENAISFQAPQVYIRNNGTITNTNNQAKAPTLRMYGKQRAVLDNHKQIISNTDAPLQIWGSGLYILNRENAQISGDNSYIYGGNIYLQNMGKISATSQNATALDIRLANKGHATIYNSGEITGNISISSASQTSDSVAFHLENGVVNGDISIGKTASEINSSELFINGKSKITGVVFTSNDVESNDTLTLLETGNLTRNPFLDFEHLNVEGDWLAQNYLLFPKSTLIKNKLTVQDGELNSAQVTINPQAGLVVNSDYVINGNLTNQGDISSADGYQTLTINGDYVGHTGSKIKMHTRWDQDNSYSDKIVIQGEATGETTVVPVDSDGTTTVIKGNVQQATTRLNTIPVISVTKSGSTVFNGAAITEGGYLANLAKRSTGNGDEYYWTMDPKSQHAPAPNVEPRTPGYIVIPHINIEQGYAIVGTLHQRQGDKSARETKTWGRTLGGHLDIKGRNRFNADTSSFGFQLGQTVQLNNNESATSVLGTYMAHHKTASKFTALQDNKQRLEKTGTGKSQAWSLGLTYTRYSQQGNYLDLVGQVSLLRNEYRVTDRSLQGNSESKQKGFSTLFSAEFGQAYQFDSTTQYGWSIEPQAQLIYQILKLDDFHDGIRKIDQDMHHGLRARLGLRLGYNAPGVDHNSFNTIYMISNIWQDFNRTYKTNVGPDKINENFSSTWAELGVGAQFALSKQSSIYADVRYNHHLDGNQRKGINANIGIKYSW
ncbi:autotransporter outer membrane beta-barrel domain-containing protein [Cricetibacter osteomyelitidis]|nr:autotransporter outer membrane beta-barrel domain-containing protein [Cricetibacter osteomyelitidis]